MKINIKNMNITEVKEEKTEITQQFESLLSNLNVVKTYINNINTEIKQLEKTVKKELKNVNNKDIKKKKDEKRISVFNQPCKLGKSRIEYTCELLESGERLNDKLGVESGVELNVMNIQKYINKYYE